MISINDLYHACVKHNWCTHASIEVYDKILRLVVNKDCSVKEIAYTVWVVSDASFDDVYKTLKSLDSCKRQQELESIRKHLSELLQPNKGYTICSIRAYLIEEGFCEEDIDRELVHALQFDRID